ncbi:unnamed protein product [Closterium sp. Naga37s-1]|nr:unnamed protein product [Closterium sp. Naga37s-1]
MLTLSSSLPLIRDPSSPAVLLLASQTHSHRHTARQGTTLDLNHLEFFPYAPCLPSRALLSLTPSTSFSPSPRTPFLLSYPFPFLYPTPPPSLYPSLSPCPIPLPLPVSPSLTHSPSAHPFPVSFPIPPPFTPSVSPYKLPLPFTCTALLFSPLLNPSPDPNLLPRRQALPWPISRPVPVESARFGWMCMHRRQHECQAGCEELCSTMAISDHVDAAEWKSAAAVLQK